MLHSKSVWIRALAPKSDTHGTCVDALLFLSQKGPILIYGEAATGKTQASLFFAKLLYTKRIVDEIFVIVTEPQSTLPAVSRLLPPLAKVLVAYSTFDIIEYLLAHLTRAHQNISLIIVDSLTAPFRVEVGYNPDESIKNLAFASALLFKAAELGNIIIATSQVHSIDGSDEPLASSIISSYFPSRLRALKLEKGLRVLLDEERQVIIRLMLGDNPDTQCYLLKQ